MVEVLSVVENDYEELIKLILDHKGDYRCLFAQDIDEVLRHFQTDTIDLIILEILWFLEHETKMKEVNAILQDIGVIMLWGRITFFEGEPRANLDFVDKIVPTPFAIKDFVEAIEYSLSKGSQTGLAS